MLCYKSCLLFHKVKAHVVLSKETYVGMLYRNAIGWGLTNDMFIFNSLVTSRGGQSSD